MFEWLSRRQYTLVQIGGYVGNSPNDPIYGFLQTHRDGTAVIVEPVKDYFDRLVVSYAHEPHVRCENVAIAEAAGQREIHRLTVDPTEYGRPEWLAQLSSLRDDRMNEIWDRYEADDGLKQFWLAHSAVELVQCVTLADLVELHDLKRIDFLQIDAEGYDYEILRTLDFERIRPSFINYERTLLQDDEPACRELLSSAGYMLIDHVEEDTLAIDVRT